MLKPLAQTSVSGAIGMRSVGFVSQSDLSRVLPYFGGSGETRTVLSMTLTTPDDCMSLRGETLASRGTQPGGAMIEGMDLRKEGEAR